MLKTAEDLAGPYVWGQYDILVLPPSFPYGGMENPCLTFATPTLLVRTHARRFIDDQCGHRGSPDLVLHHGMLISCLFLSWQAGDKSLSNVSVKVL